MLLRKARGCLCMYLQKLQLMKLRKLVCPLRLNPNILMRSHFLVWVLKAWSMHFYWLIWSSVYGFDLPSQVLNTCLEMWRIQLLALLQQRSCLSMSNLACHLSFKIWWISSSNTLLLISWRLLLTIFWALFLSLQSETNIGFCLFFSGDW